MAAVTYYCGGDAATNPFMSGGFTTNAGGADPCGSPTADQVSYGVLNKTALCGTTFQTRWNSALGIHFDHAWDTSFAVATTVTGTQFQVTIREAATFTFKLLAYNSTGTLVDSSTGVTAVNGDANKNGHTVDMSAEVVAVPAGGYVGIRSEQTTGFPARIYWGSPSGAVTGSTISGQLDVDEVATVVGVTITCVAGAIAATGKVPTIALTDYKLIACTAGSVAVTGQAPTIAIAPAPRTTWAYLKDSTGTPLPDGINVLCFIASEFAGSHTAMTPHMSGTTQDGTGFVTMQTTNINDMILVANMLDASVPSGEIIITDVITPEL